MAKIIEEEDASSDINSDNYNNNNDSYSFNYHYNNSKSQDIRIKNLTSLMMKNNIEDTPPKKIQKRPRLKSMTTPNSNFFLEEKEEILKNLSKKQRKTSDYSENDSLSFNSRESLSGVIMF